MTKTIVLSGGPDNGRTVTIKPGKTEYRIIRGAGVKGSKVTLSARQGIYQQTGEYHQLNEIFLWKGWAT